ncbi:8085_t:CDS:2 [Ambispora leptoticha]|uniref:8085_t:CDS:1 n=1 Tax=Ambispora leptoticha TaxID=144679 RepID=A0A9N9HJV2_9GLOM|nr:8085_t:CDS:2 [Ambispora leptoticha]
MLTYIKPTYQQRIERDLFAISVRIVSYVDVLTVFITLDDEQNIQDKPAYIYFSIVHITNQEHLQSFVTATIMSFQFAMYLIHHKIPSPPDIMRDQKLEEHDHEELLSTDIFHLVQR